METGNHTWGRNCALSEMPCACLSWNGVPVTVGCFTAALKKCWELFCCLAVPLQTPPERARWLRAGEGVQGGSPGATDGFGWSLQWVGGATAETGCAPRGKRQHVSCASPGCGRVGGARNEYLALKLLPEKLYLQFLPWIQCSLAVPVFRGCFGCVRRASEVHVIVLPLMRASVPMYR